ncbi:MAG: hypothetical protein GC204_14315 [Chloroflexi bacterium]|nr:hypothetical protein [Chloroflexota bacterium]
MKTRTFTSEASKVAFPLGGIGTGTVSLGARGDLRDWEIFNRPAKGTSLPNTFFALRTQSEGGAPVTRLLEGLVPPPYELWNGFPASSSVGLPRFHETQFNGEYPFATIDFADPDVPLMVQLEAYTPLIPLNADDSGIPAAIFTYRVHNPTDKPVKLTLVGSISNPVGSPVFHPLTEKRETQVGRPTNTLREDGGLHGLYLSAEGIDADALEYGNLSLVTDAPNITAKPIWLRGGWWDFLRDFWDDLDADGLLTDLHYDNASDKPETGSLGIVDTLAPGADGVYRFVLSWYFPNRLNAWPSWFNPPATNAQIRNHYATQFEDSWEVAQYILRELPRLERETRTFHDAMFDSTLPEAVVDRLSANIVPLRSNTCFWLEDGRFHGWEGCNDDVGSCSGNCTHVWSYAYTIAFLFPQLEREMRRIEFTVETEPDGYMAFRGLKSFNPDWVWTVYDGEKVPAVDGQMGSILRVYREWLLSGDKAWLSSLWPNVKKALDYVQVKWDLDGDGVLESRQHNTYDIEFYDPNPLCTFYYLAALRAASELATVMGEPDVAQKYAEIYEKGSRNADQIMWNGEFYVQRVKQMNEHPYQVGEGCLSDMLLGAVHARALGLGDILPREHLHSAIKAVYDRNFKHDFTRHVNVQRTYVFNDESGLLLGTWDAGVERPRFPFVYSDEVWTGIEYHVAANLIYEGYLDEGLAIVQAVHDRQDGMRRSPWNEVECGHHYARSMSSWLVLLALTGFHSDVDAGVMRFDPIMSASTDSSEFKSFWSNGKAWGTFTQREGEAPEIDVLGGSLDGIRVFVGEREVIPN